MAGCNLAEAGNIIEVLDINAGGCNKADALDIRVGGYIRQQHSSRPLLWDIRATVGTAIAKASTGAIA